jgi:hypothetical protein
MNGLTFLEIVTALGPTRVARDTKLALNTIKRAAQRARKGHPTPSEAIMARMARAYPGFYSLGREIDKAHPDTDGVLAVTDGEVLQTLALLAGRADEVELHPRHEVRT